MKIALISPAGRSGGGVYSQKLSEVLDATIISAGLSLPRIRSEVSKKKFDIVDIQLEYRTFGSHLRTLACLPILVFLLRGVAATVVTVHGVLTLQSLTGERFRMPKLIAFVLSVRLAALLASQVLVHTDLMRSELIRYGVKNATVIPHGSGPLSYRPQEESRDSVLFFGFIRPSKGIDRLILAFKQVTKSHPTASLVIAVVLATPTKPHTLPDSLNLVTSLGLEGKVSFRPGFLPEIEKKSLAAKAAVLTLPYTDSYLEVSGVIHDFSGYGVSVLCSKTPRFSELHDGFDCLKANVTPSELGDSICRLLEDVDLRERLASNLFRLAQSESWPSVAKMRLGVYRNAIASKARRVTADTP